MSAMDVITYTALQANLTRIMDEVCAAASHVVITREDASPVVMMSFDEYRGIAETLHLLREPANAERLMDSIAEADIITASGNRIK